MLLELLVLQITNIVLMLLIRRGYQITNIVINVVNTAWIPDY